MGLLNMGSSNPYATINPIAAALEGLTKGTKEGYKFVDDMYVSDAERKRQDALLKLQQDQVKFQSEEADRKKKQAMLEAEAREGIDRGLQGTASFKGFQQGPTEPMQAPAMQGLLSGPDPKAVFQDPRLAALMGSEQIARQPVASMGTITPPTSDEKWALAYQYAGTPSGEVLKSRLSSDDKVSSILATLGLKQEFAAKEAETDRKNQFALLQERLRGMETKADKDRELRMLLAAMRGGANNSGVKLKQGETMLPDGRVASIPGSDLYIKQSGLHSKDYQTLNLLETQTDNAISTIKDILDPKNTSAFNSNFGGWNAYATQYMPGNTQNIGAKIESLKSILKKAGLDIMRSGGAIGQMTVQEWPIVESMISTLTPKLSEKEARTQIEKIEAYLTRMRDNASSTYENEWGNTQFYKQKSQQPTAPPQPRPGYKIQRNKTTGAYREVPL